MDNYKELFAKNGLLYNVLAELLKDNTTNKNIVMLIIRNNKCFQTFN